MTSLTTLRAFWVILAVLFAAAVGFAACGDDEEETVPAATTASPDDADDGDGTATPSGEPVKVGAIYPVTGAFAAYGPIEEQGVKIAEMHINEDGGVLGRPFEVEICDDQSEATQVVVCARKFAADPSIVAFTAAGTFALEALNPIADELQTIMMINAIGSEVREDDYWSTWMFRLSLLEAPEFHANALQLAVDREGVSRLAIVKATDNPYGDLNASAVKEALPLVDGIELVAEESIRTGEPDYAAVIDKVAQAEPDIVWFATTTDEVATFARQARDRGYDWIWIGSAGIADASHCQTSDGASAGAIGYQPFDATKTEPHVVRYIEDHQAEYGAVPGSISPVTYDVIRVFADAIERAGTTDRDAVRDALGQTTGYAGVTGPITFDGSGDNKEFSGFVLRLNEDCLWESY